MLSCFIAVTVFTQVGVSSTFSLRQESAQIHPRTRAEERRNTDQPHPRAPQKWQVQHFFDKNFQDPVNVQNSGRKPQAFRWASKLQPKQTGWYKFTLSPIQPNHQAMVKMKINNKTISGSGKISSTWIHLKENQRYPIQIEGDIPPNKEASTDQFPFQVEWDIDNKGSVPIPDTYLQIPELNQPPLPESNRLPESNPAAQERAKNRSKQVKDTDADGIPDEWETNGYTVQNKKIVPWDDSIKNKGYKKMTSNPYFSHSAQDMDTDAEKATGRIDKTIRKEARDPRVSSYPSIALEDVKVIISRVENIATEKGTSTSLSEATSGTSSNEKGTGVSISTAPAMSSHSSSAESHTKTFEHSSSNSLTEHLGLNTGDAGYVTLEYRLRNRGTASMYNAKPVFNVILEENWEKESLQDPERENSSRYPEKKKFRNNIKEYIKRIQGKINEMITKSYDFAGKKAEEVLNSSNNKNSNSRSKPAQTPYFYGEAKANTFIDEIKQDFSNLNSWLDVVLLETPRSKRKELFDGIDVGKVIENFKDLDRLLSSWLNTLNNLSLSTDSRDQIGNNLIKKDIELIQKNIQKLNHSLTERKDSKKDVKQEPKKVTIATVKVRENQLAHVIKPGDTFPAKQLEPVSITTWDDFGSMRIPITYDQIEKIEAGAKLHVQLVQVDGLYGKIDRQGGLDVNESQKWEPVQAQIESVTAGVTLKTGRETLVRRFAADDSGTPLGEVMEKSFDTTKKNERLYYKDMALEEGLVRIDFDDQDTRAEFQTQLASIPVGERKYYNVKVKPGMKITITKNR